MRGVTPADSAALDVLRPIAHQDDNQPLPTYQIVADRK
jgi:hypothetical protein